MNRDHERVNMPLCGDVVAPFSFPTKATDQQYQTQVLLLSYKNDQVMENDGQVSQQIQRQNTDHIETII
jgi:hypothetical protein